jgi:cyclophilin family peptidyl-prolyl cis-trans isomerase
MIKENKDFFLYILGIIAAVFALIFLLDIVNPGSVSNDECGILGLKCWFARLTQGEKQYDSPPEMTIDTSKDYKAIVKTNYGEFEIDLYEKNAPMTVNNFVFLANEDYYDGVKFHRVAKDLLIQTGDRNTLDSDPDNDGKGGPGYTFDDEINWNSLNLSKAKIQQLEREGFSSTKSITSRDLENRAVAMANSGPNTNGSQFFIITALTSDSTVKGLEGMHTVFGRVSSGWDTVEKIENVEVDDPTSNSPRPVEDVVIEDIEILTE